MSKMLGPLGEADAGRTGTRELRARPARPSPLWPAACSPTVALALPRPQLRISFKPPQRGSEKGRLGWPCPPPGSRGSQGEPADFVSSPPCRPPVVPFLLAKVAIPKEPRSVLCSATLPRQGQRPAPRPKGTECCPPPGGDLTRLRELLSALQPIASLLCRSRAESEG